MKTKKKTKKKRLSLNLKEAVTAAYQLGLMDGEKRALREKRNDSNTHER